MTTQIANPVVEYTVDAGYSGTVTVTIGTGSCWSHIHRVPLTRNRPVRMSGGEWWFDRLDVALRWPPRRLTRWWF